MKEVIKRFRRKRPTKPWRYILSRVNRSLSPVI